MHLKISRVTTLILLMAAYEYLVQYIHVILRRLPIINFLNLGIRCSMYLLISTLNRIESRFFTFNLSNWIPS